MKSFTNRNLLREKDTSLFPRKVDLRIIQKDEKNDFLELI